MKILGLNGWTERGHDGGAALLIDGKLCFAIEEERLTKQRHAYDTKPTLSIEACLNATSMCLDDIDYFSIGWDYEYLYSLLNSEFISKEQMSIELFGTAKYADRLEYTPHHLAHAFSSFIPSHFAEALVLVIDGQGEYMGTSVYIGSQKSGLKLLMESPASLGYFYAAVTSYIGFRRGEEGKAMGLSAYGRPVYSEYFQKLFTVDEHGTLHAPFVIPKTGKDEEDATILRWKEYLAPIMPPRSGKITQVDSGVMPYADLICSAQVALENIVLRIVGKYAAEHNLRNVCLAGGVGLNCPLASQIEKLPYIEKVFTQPAANDGGVSLGAAISCAVSKGETVDFEMLPYCGWEYQDSEILKSLEENGYEPRYFENIEYEVARLLANNQIVANFQGRLEYGPRALGNRSLLASPKDFEMWTRMNILKGRELWRPLAPAVLYEHQEEFFMSDAFSPYMTMNFDVSKEHVHQLRAVTHVDFTARVQSVTKHFNERFYSIIEQFYLLTDIPVVINTSFNVKGEPIVCTPEDAIKAFEIIGVDYLCMGNYLVEKKEN